MMHDHFEHQALPADEGAVDGPMDTANQSLADALRASFRVLKLILLAVVILYLGSGIGCLDQNEQAMVMRFGELQAQPLPPGLYVLFPKPIDELIVVPVKEKRSTRILSQQMFLKPKPGGAYETFEEARDPGNRLDPTKHGSVMTGDREVVHAEWVVTYTIEDLKKFVTNILLADEQSEEDLIQVAVENAAISVIGQQVAVDVVLNKLADVQRDVRERAQEILDGIGPDDDPDSGSGIRIATVVPKLYWPKNTKRVFDSVTQAAQNRERTKRQAEQDAAQMLTGAAGPAHDQLRVHFDDYMAAKARGDADDAAETMGQIEELILTQASGQAGERIRAAESLRKNALEEIQADYDEYVSYLNEYRTNPQLLFARLWNQTQLEILTSPDVTKRILPAGRIEFRLLIGQDPEEKKQREIEGYRGQTKDKKAGDFSRVKPGDQTPVIKQKLLQ
jgi:regulator of protease activity HflC (stomatin/prohibitin superfamily)